MNTQEQQARMWVDLLTTEIQADAMRDRATDQAELYLSFGLPLDQVLDALKISRATWYRRQAERGERRDAAREAQ